MHDFLFQIQTRVSLFCSALSLVATDVPEWALVGSYNEFGCHYLRREQIKKQQKQWVPARVWVRLQPWLFHKQGKNN